MYMYLPYELPRYIQTNIRPRGLNDVFADSAPSWVPSVYGHTLAQLLCDTSEVRCAKHMALEVVEQ